MARRRRATNRCPAAARHGRKAAVRPAGWCGATVHAARPGSARGRRGQTCGTSCTGFGHAVQVAAAECGVGVLRANLTANFGPRLAAPGPAAMLRPTYREDPHARRLVRPTRPSRRGADNRRAPHPACRAARGAGAPGSLGCEPVRHVSSPWTAGDGVSPVSYTHLTL